MPRFNVDRDATHMDTFPVAVRKWNDKRQYSKNQYCQTDPEQRSSSCHITQLYQRRPAVLYRKAHSLPNPDPQP